MEVNDILYSKLGYMQVGVEFFQVIKVNTKTIRLRRVKTVEIASGKCSTQEVTIPEKDNFIGPSFLAYPYLNFKGETLFRNKTHLIGTSARKWEGKPLSYTAYA